MKYENIDLISAMRQIMELHTKHYKEDFELDAKLLCDMASSESAEDKHLLWMSRPNGTHILREREVKIPMKTRHGRSIVSRQMTPFSLMQLKSWKSRME